MVRGGGAGVDIAQPKLAPTDGGNQAKNSRSQVFTAQYKTSTSNAIGADGCNE